MSATPDDSIMEILDMLNDDHALYDVTIGEGEKARFNPAKSFVFAQTAHMLARTIGVSVTVVPHRDRSHLRVVK